MTAVREWTTPDRPSPAPLITPGYNWNDAKDKAAIALARADDAWVHQAYLLILRLARRQESLHVNDVWDYIDAHGPRLGWKEPSDRRLLGRAFRQAQKQGIIVCTDTAKKVRHNGGHYWRPIWRSLVFGQPTKPLP